MLSEQKLGLWKEIVTDYTKTYQKLVREGFKVEKSVTNVTLFFPTLTPSILLFIFLFTFLDIML